jgi:cytoskeletal protein RodZ
MSNTSSKRWQYLVLALALVATLAVGLAIGLWIQLQSNTARMVEVVVTATPDPANQTVARTSGQTDDAAPKTDQQAKDSPPDSEDQSEAGLPTATETTVAIANEAGNAQATPTPSIMEFLLSDARHFQGDSDAPLTLIEFSDFK